MDKIAIIGMSCLLPDAETPDAFWQNLIDGKDATSQATSREIGTDARVFYDPEKGKTDRCYCFRGGYVRGFEFDPNGYRIPPDYLDGLDDTCKWSLYVSRQALMDSGYLDDESDLSRCGVILGNLSFPTRTSHRLITPIYRQALEPDLRRLLQQENFRLNRAPDSEDPPPGAATGLQDPASVVARGLGLGGAGFCLDAACASSLYAVELAARYLRCGSADLMLAGAVSCAHPLFVHMGFSIFQAYPENGKSAPLDRSSGGLVAGEGAGVFVLKRYEDAVRDGDRIHAIVLGVGWSNDGRGKSVLRPSTKGQVLALKRAYACAGIAPESIGYLECHATGTPAGDVSEIDTMDSFFGGCGGPASIGAVKSNLGHLLTAAGMAGMLKAVLSMSRGLIPPTVNLSDPLPSKVVKPEQFVRSATAWPDRDAPRRAAVSAFGFGGVNAHIVLGLEETRSAVSLPEASAARRQTVRMAVVGMDACFGRCGDLETFGRSVYQGTGPVPLPRQRWKGVEDRSRLLQHYGFGDGKAPDGAYIEGFEVDFLRFKVPALDDDRATPQHLLALKVADRALQDARMEAEGNVAVILAMGAEPALHQFLGRCDLVWQVKDALARAGISLSPSQRIELETIAKDSIHSPAKIHQYTSFIGNIMASRISALWDFSGPAFTVSAEENSAFRALEIAQMLLSAGEVDAVVVGAVDLAGGVENVLLRNRKSRTNTGRHTLSYDQSVNGWTVGEGAGAVVLKRLDQAEDGGDRIYAAVDTVALVSQNARVEASADVLCPPVAEGVLRVCRKAFRDAGISPADVGYLEVFGSGIAEEDHAEIRGLTEAYRTSDADLTCAIGTAKTTVGHTFFASGMAAFIKTALCLHHHYVPGTPGWETPKMSACWQGAPFYVPGESRTWFQPKTAGRRVAAINGLSADGSYAHLILSEASRNSSPVLSRYLRPACLLFPLAGKDLQAVQRQLDELQDALQSGKDLPSAAAGCHVELRADAPFALSLVARDRETLIREIRAASVGMARAFETGVDWKTPQGSYFTANPLGKAGKVAFVYPGSADAYPGMGRHFLQMFPRLHETVSEMTSDLGGRMCERRLYPRCLNRPAAEDLEAVLQADAAAMFQAGVSMALLYTTVLKEYFKVIPRLAFGSSLGESSMLFSLGVWSGGDDAARAIQKSALFSEQLFGPKTAVREQWGLPHDDTAFWSTYAVLAPAAKVEACLKGHDRVYLTMVNAPQEVIIAGDTAGCREVIRRLGCESIPAPFNGVLHCNAVDCLEEAFARLHVLPVRDVRGIDFYSSFSCVPLALDTDTLARNIGRVVANPVDFPRIVNTVYDDGARVFVDLGPRGTCAHWVEQILKDRPHVAVPVAGKGVDDFVAIVKALARLVSHRVSLDLSDLYDSPPNTAHREKSLVRTVALGGPRIESIVRTKANIEKFRSRTATAPPLPSVHREGAGQDVRPEPASPAAAVSLRDAWAIDPDGVPDLFYQKLGERATHASQGHAAFLALRQESLSQLGKLIQLQMAHMSGRPLPLWPAPQGEGTPGIPRTTFQAGPPDQMHERLSLVHAEPSDIVWGQADLLEFAGGSIARVFGPAYEVIDTYPRRVRLPMSPYLLVSRVTRLDAERGVFRPSSITTEYDIPKNAWYSVDNQIPWAVAVESGQCDLLLISYLGIDFECKGDRIYRLLDCTLTFLDDLPKGGESLRYEIRINSFSRTEDNLLFFFSYTCFVKDKMVLKMDGGCAGFFSDGELARGKGIVLTEEAHRERQRIQKRTFAPLLSCPARAFDKRDLRLLTQGDLAACLGAPYEPDGRNPSLRLPAEEILMIDRIVSVDPVGGAWGLGLVVAEKDLAPDDWYFPCHFKDDQVLAGSLMAEGCVQILQFYLLYLGLQTHTTDARFQPILRLPQVVRCRGQVTPVDTKLTYRMELTDIELTPEPCAKANVDILVGEKVVVNFKDLGLRLSEKYPPGSSAQAHGRRRISRRKAPPEKPVFFDERQIEEFATGSVVRCFGPEYRVYDGRRAPRTPNGALKLISRIIDVEGNRHDFQNPARIVSEYDVPKDAWFYRENAYPTLPYAICMEMALQPCGFLSAYLGSPLQFPEIDFHFRNLDGTGKLLGLPADLCGKTVTNRSQHQSTTAIEGTIIQSFEFELSCDASPFYTGTAVFGYFTHAALTDGIGLDGGERVRPWYVQQGIQAHTGVSIDLTGAEESHGLYRGAIGKPHYRLSGGRLNFLENAFVVPRGGQHGQGYIYASSRVHPHDWFFPCHFYQDPVMPGSLGMEAIFQAMQIYALQQRIAERFTSPCFVQLSNHRTAWKYRGQILPDDGMMQLEVHIKQVDTDHQCITLTGDASLWKDDMRIYEVTDAAVNVEEATQDVRP